MTDWFNIYLNKLKLTFVNNKAMCVDFIVNSVTFHREPRNGNNRILRYKTTIVFNQEIWPVFYVLLLFDFIKNGNQKLFKIFSLKTSNKLLVIANNEFHRGGF